MATKKTTLRTLSEDTRWWARAALAMKAGITFGGARDLYTALGYKRVLTLEDYRARYERGGLSARLVECKPDDTWRGGGEIIEDADPDTLTTFEAEFEKLNQRIKIWPKLRQLDVLAGLGHYAVIVIGAPGELHLPLERASAQDIKYLSVYAEDDAKIQEYDDDPASARFGWPTKYTLQRKAPAPANSSKSMSIARVVHYTRVVHVADNTIDHEAYGQPRLERVWNLLDDLDKVTGGGAEAFWRRADQGMQFDIDPTIKADDEELARMQSQVDEFVHGYKRMLRTRGMKINTLGSDVANFEGPSKAVLEQICGAVGIPLRVLLGSEQAKLAAEQDSTNYYQRIEARRADFADPRVVRPLIDRLIELGALPAPTQYEVRWSQLRTRDEKEKVDIAAKAAGINQAQGEIVVTVDEIREHFLGLPPLEPQEEPEPEPDRQAAAPAWKAVHKAADASRKALMKAIRKAFTTGQRKLGAALKAALTAKDEQEVMSLVSEAITASSKVLEPALVKMLKTVISASGSVAANRLRKMRAATNARFADDGFAFDKTNPAVLKWIAEHAAETIEGISKTTRDSIRDLVESAFEDQFTVDDLAKEIGELIGDPERAELIARTETIRASNAGQQLAWEQATEEGLLTGNESQEWITTPDDRLCPICEPMDGVTVPLGESFDVAGDRIEGPPAHPNCRCTVGLTVEPS